jgi:hypothetical protein
MFSFTLLELDCGNVSASLSDEFVVSVDTWHILNTHSDYKNGEIFRTVIIFLKNVSPPKKCKFVSVCLSWVVSQYTGILRISASKTS